MPPAMTTARDIPLLITSTASSSERRITPSWTIAHLKTKLEPVTGIPPSSQRLSLRLPDQTQETAIQADNEDGVEIGRWPLVAYAEIKVQTVKLGIPPIPYCSSCCSAFDIEHSQCSPLMTNMVMGTKDVAEST